MLTRNGVASLSPSACPVSASKLYVQPKPSKVDKCCKTNKAMWVRATLEKAREYHGLIGVKGAWRFGAAQDCSVARYCSLNHCDDGGHVFAED